MRHISNYSSFFFFNDTATTEIYTLSLHDALPIWPSLGAAIRSGIVDRAWSALTDHRSRNPGESARDRLRQRLLERGEILEALDRKSTRLNSSHQIISYAVFCLKKKTKIANTAGEH